MKSKSLDWKIVGRFIALLVQLFTIVSSVFKKAGLGLEAIEWFVGSGKDILVGKLEELAAEFTKANPPENPKLGENSLVFMSTFDTDAEPKLPFDGARIEFHAKGGLVSIVKKDGELWIGGKKVVLHCVGRQQGGKTIRGHELREELSGKPVLNARILDFLLEHTDYIPESWKKNEAGNTIYIFFWGTIYRNTDGNLCVRCLYWYGGVWDRYYRWLGSDWNGYRPAALLAS
jgi:hypothetical protein